MFAASKINIHMNAVVFDCPGTLRMFQNKGVTELEAKSLDIQNYCPLPTIISSLGEHTSPTIWHLDCDLQNYESCYVDHIVSYGFSLYFNVDLMATTAHYIDVIERGFDSTTGYPKKYRQIQRWPVIPKFNPNLWETCYTLFFIKIPMWLYHTTLKKLGYKLPDEITWYEAHFSVSPTPFVQFYNFVARYGYWPNITDDATKLKALEVIMKAGMRKNRQDGSI